MFCPICGRQLPNSALFCMACGNEVNKPKPMGNVWPNNNGIATQMSTRQENIRELDRAISYFNNRSDQYNKNDYLQETIQRYMRLSKKPMLIIGIVLTAIGFSIAMFITRVIRYEVLVLTLISGLAYFSVGYLGLIFLLVFYISNSNRKKRLRKLVKELIEISQELATYYASFGPCVVDAELSNPLILNGIRNTIRDERAETIKEAINVMLNDAHKSQMQLISMLNQLRSLTQSGLVDKTQVFCAANFFRARR